MRSHFCIDGSGTMRRYAATFSTVAPASAQPLGEPFAAAVAAHDQHALAFEAPASFRAEVRFDRGVERFGIETRIGVVSADGLITR